MDYLTASSNSRIPNIVEEMVGDVRIFAREQWRAVDASRSIRTRWDGIPVHGTISLRRYSFSDTFAFFVPGKMLLSPASLFFYRFLDREEAVNLMHPTNPGPFIYLSLVDPSFRGRTIRAQFYIYSARRLESSSRFSRKSLHPEIGLCIDTLEKLFDRSIKVTMRVGF